jgi:acetyl-CoA/propionyl-CoA carboxylase biotin carboxyl carrier protein
VTGVDLVREQVLIAAGEPTSLRQEELGFRGHAIECRINAEDPSSGFLPTPGVLTRYREPAGPGVRVDSGVVEGGEISGLYDPLVAKLCVWDTDRERARARMLRALDEFEIEGVKTLVGFHKALLRRACFIAGETCHGVVESEELAQEAEELSHGTTPVPRSADGHFREHTVEVEVDDRRFEVKVMRPESPFAELARRRRERTGGGAGHGAARDAVVSPMQGTVLAVEVAEGDEVRAGQVICIVEAMKMENEITAHREGLVTGLSVSVGEAVKTGQVICVVSRNGEPEGGSATQ